MLYNFKVCQQGNISDGNNYLVRLFDLSFHKEKEHQGKKRDRKLIVIIGVKNISV